MLDGLNEFLYNVDLMVRNINQAAQYLELFMILAAFLFLILCIVGIVCAVRLHRIERSLQALRDTYGYVNEWPPVR